MHGMHGTHIDQHTPTTTYNTILSTTKTGAVQVLSDLSRATSTAQPGVVRQAVEPEKNKTKPVLAIEQDSGGGGGANATKELTFEALKDLNKERQSEQEETEDEEDKVSAAGGSGGSSSRRSGSSQSKKKKRKKRNAAQRKKKKNKLLLFDRMKVSGCKHLS